MIARWTLCRIIHSKNKRAFIKNLKSVVYYHTRIFVFIVYSTKFKRRTRVEITSKRKESFPRYNRWSKSSFKRRLCAYIFFFPQREAVLARFRWIRKESEKLSEEIEIVLLHAASGSFALSNVNWAWICTIKLISSNWILSKPWCCAIADTISVLIAYECLRMIGEQ